MLPPGTRKSKIRPPRRSLLSFGSINSTGEDFDYDKTWRFLSNAITLIQRKNVSNLSYEQLYRKAYTLVLKKCGSRLYDDVSKEISAHLKMVREKLLQEYDVSSAFNETRRQDFMKSVLKEWEEHTQAMKFISDVLMYLNRVYVQENKKLLIYDLGIELFKEKVIKYDDNKLGNKLIEVVVEEITRSRKGEAVSSKMYITKIINMFEQLSETTNIGVDIQNGESYYVKYFEPYFLSSSEKTFYSLADEYLEDMNGSVYIQNVQKLIKDEEDRIKFYLPDSTFPKVISLMNNILIKDRLDIVLSMPEERPGLSYWLQPALKSVFEPETCDSHIFELKTLYELIARLEDDFNLLKSKIRQVILLHGELIPQLVQNYISKREQTMKSPSKRSSSDITPFAIAWIESVLKYYRAFDLILDGAFHKNPSMKLCVTKSIMEFINTSLGISVPKKTGISTSNAPELLSIFIDHQIKQLTKPSGSLTKILQSGGRDSVSSCVDEVEELICELLLFLSLIKDKDAFEIHYANHFAKRFLNSKSSSGSSAFTAGAANTSDLEELFLSKLCEELGSASLEKVIKMNIDVRSSRELTSEWKTYSRDHNIKDCVDVELKICNLSFWPKSMTKDYKKFTNDDAENGSYFIWPKQLRQTIKRFEDFWVAEKKNENKSLFWCPRFGSVDLRITYPSRTYDINVHTFAAIILLLFGPQSLDSNGLSPLAFEEKRQLTYEEIKELTGIPEGDLKRQLQSIAVAPRLRLLVKSPMSKEINNGDMFMLNENFKAPSAKVKVLTVSSSSSNASDKKSKDLRSQAELEKEELSKQILETRKREVDAAIVRIMKSAKSLRHNELVEELIKQLYHRFQCPNILIKQRIEDLMEKEYLRRDEKDRSVYHYIS